MELLGSTEEKVTKIKSSEIISNNTTSCNLGNGTY